MLDSQTLVISAIALILPAAYLLYRHYPRQRAVVLPATAANEQKPLKSIMQPPREDLAPPKDDPFTPEQLREYDGSDPTKPIYVAIKSTIFDVSHKIDVYGYGKSYNVFAGKDGSRGLGMSSLKLEDAVADYSVLNEADMKVLNDWHAFFSKRYNVVGRVVGPPASSM